MPKGLIDKFQIVEHATAIVAPGTDHFIRLDPHNLADCFSHKQWLTRKTWMDRRPLEQQARSSL